MHQKHPDIPVPKVFAVCYGSTKCNSFLAEDLLEATPLSESWLKFSDEEKRLVARKLAKLIVRMAEIRFEKIGGFTGDFKDEILGPTVEGSKLFKGRVSIVSRPDW